jgi:asparagine synthase (glutamine-hydrolysing)
MCVIQDRSGRWIEAPLWHPSRFATRDRLIRDGSEAARLLREAALRAVAAQPHGEKIVLRLSGGLDSSIIASCLSAAGLEFSCINFATRARDGDEREHARAVAQSLGLDLVEVTEGEPARLEAPSRRSFRPLLNPLLEPFERAVCETALALGADLLIDGAGGDNLFCSITSAAPLLDAIFSGNIGQAGRAANDIAMRANCTIWDVLLSAGRRLSRRGTQWKEDRSFLDARALLRTCDPHPWLQGLAVPPGKREHVEALVHIQHFLDRTQSSIPLLHPLLAQPLLELCLQVPSWLWVRGGRDRAIARDAFDGLVPASILRRRMKGSLQSLLYRSFSELRAEMRGLLLEGELASLGVVDTAAITDALGSEQWMADEVQLRISEMTALELWLRSWRADGASFSIAA